MLSSNSAVIVTGAASGLGEAVVRYLAEYENETHVVLADLNEEQGRDIAAELGGTFVRTVVTAPQSDEVG